MDRTASLQHVRWQKMLVLCIEWMFYAWLKQVSCLITHISTTKLIRQSHIPSDPGFWEVSGAFIEAGVFLQQFTVCMGMSVVYVDKNRCVAPAHDIPQGQRLCMGILHLITIFSPLFWHKVHISHVPCR